MNHRLQADSVYIRYRITWDTDPALQPVVPVGFDASHLRQGLVYDVPGGGPPGLAGPAHDDATLARHRPASSPASATSTVGPRTSCCPSRAAATA